LGDGVSQLVAFLLGDGKRNIIQFGCEFSMQIVFIGDG
jgi:hypothetical protein